MINKTNIEKTYVCIDDSDSDGILILNKEYNGYYMTLYANKCIIIDIGIFDADRFITKTQFRKLKIECLKKVIK